MIALLIDADNFSSPAWVSEAVELIERNSGPIAVRRAYGSFENIKGLAEVLRVHSIRPFVNLFLPKNTTDVSLAVDAMELACESPCPKQIVIASGDMDFVPLVVRLRERGIRVVCVSEASKMAQVAKEAYDQILYVGAEQAVVSKAKPQESASVAAKPLPAKKAPAKAVSPKPSPAKSDTKKPASKVAKTPATRDDILKALPELRTGKWQHLSGIAKTLHDKGLLAKSAPSTKLFREFPQDFELKPTSKPNQVRYTGS